MRDGDIIKCNQKEVKDLEQRWREDEKRLEKELKAIRAKRRLIKRELEKNVDEESGIITLPTEALADRKDNQEKTINWKRLVWQMFETYKIPMTSELLYHKLLLNCDEVPLDRKFVIRNISAALHYLEGKDQKLFRSKNSGKKGFVYGLKHFFDFNFNLKPDYLKRYRMEEGEEIMMADSLRDANSL